MAFRWHVFQRQIIALPARALICKSAWLMKSVPSNTQEIILTAANRQVDGMNPDRKRPPPGSRRTSSLL